MTFQRELDVARDLAWRAGQQSLQYMRQGVTAEDKSDDSPVTIADREAEKLFVAGLQAAFPDDGLMGEEGASKEGAGGRRWIIDPVDGTRDFVRKNRLWANLVALEVDGVVELGVATFPALDEVYWGVRGAGAWRLVGSHTEQLHHSGITDVRKAVLCANRMQDGLIVPYSTKLLDFMAQFWAVRSLGGAMDAMFVCSGSAEIWLEPTCKPWDLAVLQVIAHGAGCRFFDYHGKDHIYGDTAVICTPAMEGEVRGLLGLE
jgi:histidinol-phosphatase